MKKDNIEIDKLLEQDLSYEEIADLIGIDLIDLIDYVGEKRGKSLFGARPNIIERRKAVCKLAREDKQGLEIASKLEISIISVENDLAFLRRNGILKRDKEIRQKRKEERRQELIVLYGKVSIEDLAERYGVAINTIKDDINDLIKEGKIELTPSRREEIKSEIVELREKFYVSEIARMYGVSPRTIGKLIQELKREGLIDETKVLGGRKSRAKLKEIEDRRTRVASLYDSKKSNKEIASILGVSETTVRKRH